MCDVRKGTSTRYSFRIHNLLIPALIEISKQETEAEPPARATGAAPARPEQAPQGEGGQGEGQEVCAQSQTEAQECRQEHGHAQGSHGEQCDCSHHRVQAQSVHEQQVIHLPEQPGPGELPHDKQLEQCQQPWQ